jgi:hypothetical protein
VPFKSFIVEFGRSQTKGRDSCDYNSERDGPVVRNFGEVREVDAGDVAKVPSWRAARLRALASIWRNDTDVAPSVELCSSAVRH